MTTTLTRPASDRQIALIARLSGEKDVPVAGADFAEARLIARWEDALSGRYVNTVEASAVIDWLFTLPRTVAPTVEGAPASGPAEPGVYVLGDGSIVKVQQNKAKTSVYALRWIVIGGERLTEADDERVHGEWSYEAGLVRQVSAAHRMTLEQAKAFTLRYGQCARCSRKLKAAESVEQGIGPVCRKEFSF